MFEWDETKRLATLEKHSIDFIDAAEIFLQEHLLLMARSEIEDRRIAVGQFHGVFLAVIHTRRGDSIRIITARRARKYEREQFEAYVARRTPGEEG
ncbi:MAG: BrnT family toxin [Pseudotabrizicola sp.]|uniref:BrnT family toxin n=1 Tax=Pseudotabrizicola sp. TaxID=2939647 RepID=UPI00271A2CCB|nr:BrnT family toxin [Pseudotabrizicola sp.]MDO9639197.1 BrnT family toxin [Pseudotabrizicola sp.]